MLATSYTLTATTPLSFDDAVERVRAELATEGFGVLCEIDVQATLREKLGVEQEPYTILGACSPPLAHQALGVEPELGALLPCNVVVYERNGETHISASKVPIRRLHLEPERCLPLPQALKAIRAADIITVGPGSLYTSILPNLLVAEVGGFLLIAVATAGPRHIAQHPPDGAPRYDARGSARRYARTARHCRRAPA